MRRVINRLGAAYAASGKTFGPTQEDVAKRAEEKDIPVHQARAELWEECRSVRERSVESDLKLMRLQLSKPVRRQLGIPGAGRPAGSKKSQIAFSKAELYKKLKYLIRLHEESNLRLTRGQAAKALGLKYPEKLSRLLKNLGEERDWRELVDDLSGRQ